MEKLTLSVEEAAKVLGLGRSAAYQAARNGQIPVVKIGGRYLVSKVALEVALEKLLSCEKVSQIDAK